MIILEGFRAYGDYQRSYQVTGTEAWKIGLIVGDPIRINSVVTVTITDEDLTDVESVRTIDSDPGDGSGELFADFHTLRPGR